MLHTNLLCRRSVVLAIFLAFFVPAASTGDVAAQKTEAERIDEINKMLKEEELGWKAGKTSVSHLVDRWEEFFPPMPETPDEILATLPVITAPLDVIFPDVWDWRTMGGMTPVKNQYDPEGCNSSCWAFAAVAQLESHIRIFDGRIEDLSEQQMISCNMYDHGCEGGNPYSAYDLFVDPGAVTEACMPYEASEEVTCVQDACSIHGRISGYSVVSNDMNSLKWAVMESPIVVAMYAPGLFGVYAPEPDGSGGWINACYEWPWSAPYVNHSVLLIGWDDTQCDGEGAWIIKNSFGEDWGMYGYAYVKYGTALFAATSLGGTSARQIQYIQQSDPVDLYVQKPNGGEAWVEGSQRSIKWHSISGIDHFEVGYYVGQTYNIIDDDVSGDIQELSWEIPNDVSIECRIEIKAYDESNSLIALDASDECFAILEPIVEWGLGGSAICTAANVQILPQIAAAEGGGAYIAWHDRRISTSDDIYAQKVDGYGNPVWALDGVPICTASGIQDGVRLIDDGNGGVIIAWQDKRSGDMDIYAQRVGADGTAQWQANGVALCTATLDQSHMEIVSDGNGGAIVVWEDARGLLTTRYDIYAQRIDHGGNVMWAANGVAVCVTDEYQNRPQIVTDDMLGAIIVWQDGRDTDPGIYAQRLDPDGNAIWAAGGIRICEKYTNQQYLRCISDDLGGAILSWQDRRNIETGTDVFCQRIDADGVIQWMDGGVSTCSADGEQVFPVLASDGASGAIVVWDDESLLEECEVSYAPLGTCGKRNVYAQRVDVYGNTVWAENGIAICSEAEDQIGPQVTFDGSGGAVIVWMDYRDGDCDVYAQRIDAYGTIQMYNNGEPVCLRAGDQEYLKVTTDHGADLMFVWVDEDSDIFAQKLIGDFSTPPVSCDVTWEIVDANTGLPTGGDRLSGCPAGDWLALKVHLDFSGGPIDASSISVAYDLPLIFWDENTADGPATFENGFHTTLTRKYISVDGYKTGECPLFDISILLDGVEIGRIEDLSIKSADYTGDGFVNLKDWRAFERTYNYCAGNGKYNDWFDFNCDGCVDLSDYSYISEHYMHKVPGNLDGMLAENVRDLDKEAPTIEGVQGDAENPVYRDFLEGNHPNPFNPSTTIRYSIAEDAHVNLSIYGADGRLVRTLVDRVKERGKHSATWDGMNEQGVAVASGIYFYRMRTGSYAESKKLILLR